ncbi:hypothetical protein EJ419_00510 [Alloscardovia theropitheci]|uniref:Uncharacterized protein n=1 Tax=Alloscardovia theropitheci TaxID=2496842 RepID=A0A4R0QYX3_9BIFI|nr:hypothetical protein [Alloscardovia theropitheci]TCD54911.1 hypothetical protein EJ419_00510 [Alloscardovia theropitheci]
MKLRNQIIRMICFSIIGVAASLLMVVRSFTESDITGFALFISGIVVPFILLGYAIRVCSGNTQVWLALTNVVFIIASVTVFLFSETLCNTFGCPRYDYGSFIWRPLYATVTILMCIGSVLVTIAIARLRKTEEVVHTPNLNPVPASAPIPAPAPVQGETISPSATLPSTQPDA